MDKLSYKIEDFEGPLDLLLQLIAKNKLSINDIKLVVLVDQYLEQIKAFQSVNMDIASEFLEMAARLIYMKTVSLLPKHDEVEALKQELQIELMAYERCRKTAEIFAKMQDGFNTFVKPPEKIEYDKTYNNIHESELILNAYTAMLGNADKNKPPNTAVFNKIVAKKVVSVSSKIVFVLRNLWSSGRKKLSSMFDGVKSRSELVATFLAVLELCKANRITIDGEGEDVELSVSKRKESNKI